MKRRLGIVLGLVFLFVLTVGAQQKSVLFIGNSYTYYNNMPQILVDMALTTGDSLIVDSSTPGGARLVQHAVNPQTLSKIASNNWDYVAIQAQSQEPSWPISQVQTEVFPHAKTLCDSIRSGSSCSMPVFFMTWGRKNGDASNCPNWPPVCTYQGMDSLLSERYQTMADDNDGLVSPVGAVWKYLRANHPSIELYTADESHPSAAGSYAAACAFYVTILRKDPTLISFNGTLTATEAQQIRAAAKTVVFDDFLQWNIGAYDPIADFSFTEAGTTVNFTNTSVKSDQYLWFFGDGDSSSLENPIHTYASPGEYLVTLDAISCDQFSVHTDTVSIVLGVEDNQLDVVLKVYPNPANQILQIDLNSLSGTGIYQLEIIDLNGKSIHTEMVNNQQSNIAVEVSNIPSGFYFVKVSSTRNNALIQPIEIVH